MIEAVPGSRPALPRWVWPVALYLASRVFSSAILAAVFAIATANHWEFASARAHPDFFTFSGSWDASAYRQIGEHGYPTSLPRDASGAIATNVWAFLPVYPWIVHALSSVTGLSFYTAGTIVSLVCGAGATLALYYLLEPFRGRGASLWAVALFCFGPLGFVLQIAYAESLFLLLLFAALAAASRRHYLLTAVLGCLAAFTRPGALALSLALLLVVIHRWRDRDDPFPVGQRVAAVVAGAAIAAAGLAWPFVVAAVTGEPGGYLAAELAYWAPLVGRHGFVPGEPWFLLAWTYLRVGGVILVVLIAVAVGWWLARRRRAAIGVAARSFTASYALYLFAVFLPQQSILRLMLPLAPLLGDPVFDRGRRFRGWALGVGAVLQMPAVVGLWFLSFP